MATQGHYPARRGDLHSEPMRKGWLDADGRAGAASTHDRTPPTRSAGPEALPVRMAQEHAGLIGRFGHDVRGVLGAADGYAQLLELRLAGPLSDEQERDIARIRALLRTATALVDDIVHATQAEPVGSAASVDGREPTRRVRP